MIRLATAWPIEEFRKNCANCLEIGLVNNMPGTALEATERQFLALLKATAEGMMIRLSLYALPDVPRSQENRRYIDRSYSSISDLWNNPPDALIVTGAEPLASNLTSEPYWGNLMRLTEWAEHNTHSTIWSCLAAHAAVLQLDGIPRRPLSEKLSGVFACARVSESPLTGRTPARWHMPHSRWNDVPDDALAMCGYQILTRSPQAGVDAFVKQRKSLFLFFQGHPEYDADSLLLEYRRDVRRFLLRERDSYPSMPQGCLDEYSATLLDSTRERALSERREDLLAEFPLALLTARIRNTWRSTATEVYRNWLLHLCWKKEQRLRQIRKHTKRVNDAPLLDTGAQAASAS